MTQQHGRRYEHELSGQLDGVTAAEVWCTTVGYSGNATIDACDIVITLDPRLLTKHDSPQINVEAKKRQGEGGKRVSNVFSGGENEETGVEELTRFVMGTPRWADPIVAIKFDRRELVVLDAHWILSAIGESKRYIPNDVDETIMSVLKPRVTPSNNISMIKPSLDDWQSASAGADDGAVLANQLGLPTIDDE